MNDYAKRLSLALQDPNWRDRICEMIFEADGDITEFVKHFRETYDIITRKPYPETSNCCRELHQGQITSDVGVGTEKQGKTSGIQTEMETEKETKP